MSFSFSNQTDCRELSEILLGKAGMKVHGVATMRKIRVGEVQNGGGYSYHLRFVNFFVVFAIFVLF